MTGQLLIDAAIKRVKAKYDVQEIHSTHIRYCDFDWNKQIQDIAEISIRATITVQNSVMTTVFYITISDNDSL